MSGTFEGLDRAMQLLIESGKKLAHEEESNEMQVREINGRTYQRYDDRWLEIKPDVPEDEPVPKTVQFFTLQGIVDYVNLNPEHLIPENGEKVMLQVVDETTVALISPPSKNRKNRSVIARADAHVPSIMFERYMKTDVFCTMLMSKFVDTESRRQLFAVVKSMTKEQTASTTDDGVGQHITVKSGVSLATNVTVQNPIPLVPIRTFTEVEQPVSNFTLRVNEDADVSLFESDGGHWKNDAVENIKEFLKEQVVNPAVIVIA